MTRLFLLLLFSSSFALGQARFLVRVFDNDHNALNATVTNVDGVNVVRNLDYPDLQLNALAVLVQEPAFEPLRNQLNFQYQGEFRLIPDPLIIPNEGSGDPFGAPLDPLPSSSNPALDSLVSGRPITSPPAGPITGKIIVDLVGTGIDQSHPDLAGLTFEPDLSAMFATMGGFLPGSIDYHNHETRLAGCVAGIHTGLLTALGTRTDATYRSVLCYDKPAAFGPTVPFTYVTDCMAALSELIFAHEARLATPYLKNHGSVMCFAHSVESSHTRVGDLDSLFDLAWERGIVTSLSAGNRIEAAASSSPAGAGEWIVSEEEGSIVSERYWPAFGGFSYALPGAVGFETLREGSEYHLKSGAHDNTTSPAPWVLGGDVGSALNTANPIGLGPPMNHGVDVFTPGSDIKVPATRLDPESGSGPVLVDGSTYHLEQGYQTGSGTSYSAAFTAALATRILQLRPWASPAQVRDAIIGTEADFNVLTIPDLTTLDPMSLTYDDWINRYFEIAAFGFFDGGLDAKLADPDKDGVVNLIEYLCGMDPRFPDARHAPKISLDEVTHTMKVEMQIAAYLPTPAALDWQFQSSGDLSDWEDLGQGTVTLSPHSPTNGDGVDLSGTRTFTTADDEKSFRLKIQETP